MSDLLPANATQAERALAGATERIGDVPAAVRDVWDPDTCPDALLPWLAWAFSVDEWDPAWSDAQKRDVIRRSVLVHRYKGTIGAVREAINALGIGAVLVEWFRQIPSGAPYTFRLQLEADQEPITMPAITKLLQVVESTKNLRSHLESVQPGAASTNEVYIGCATVLGLDITVQPGD